ncbi:MAG: hypothetical protein AB7P40_22840 [Chloroflexota bacterium]
MLRTFAVLLLLLGLATATPMVCLCAEDGMIGLAMQPASVSVDGPGHSAVPVRESDAPNLIAASVAAAVSSLIATAAGVPMAAPWQLPQMTAARLLPPPSTSASGQVWSPALPPPRAA